MENQIKTTLGINQGTRYIGLAVFSGTNLSDWGVKAMKGQTAAAKQRKALKMVRALLTQYQPTTIALKRLSPARGFRNLRTLTLGIQKIAGAKAIKTFQFSISDLKKQPSEKEAVRNKKELAQFLASQYPDLYPELEKEKRNRNPYHIRMFEAVALGALANDKSLNS